MASVTSFSNHFRNFTNHFRKHPTSDSVSNPAEMEEYKPVSGHVVDLFKDYKCNPAQMEAFNPEASRFIEARTNPDRTWNVLFVGGILNEAENVGTNVEKLREKTGVTIAPFWNPVYAAQKEDRRPKEEVVQALALTIEEHLKVGRLCLIAHSHGTRVLAMALENLRARNVIQLHEDKLEVYGFGGVEGIPEEFASRVVNYKNKDDHVQSLGKLLWHHNKSVEWAKLDGPGEGHQFDGGYDEVAAEEVKQFVLRSSN
ncbi:MAG: hypothetical protein KDK59_10360 [Simkania sp.]|nr:hypothetical protein [Simkania sp.]